jgi:hypothetical protein
MTTSADIDLTPPPVDVDKQLLQYLYNNLVRIQELLAALDAGQGASDTFTTADAKTVTVVNGVITSIV